ncbi:MAG: CcmD family protein [Sphingobacteriales bacterium]|jgi:hypothetical protein|nr:CcmD family protein [Sphingobacteriales bacterium]
MKNYLTYLLFSLLVPVFANAQGLDNLLRSNGRIYVVIGVILIIFIGIILYLIRIERKINKLEKQNH